MEVVGVIDIGEDVACLGRVFSGCIAGRGERVRTRAGRRNGLERWWVADGRGDVIRPERVYAAGTAAIVMGVVIICHDVGVGAGSRGAQARAGPWPAERVRASFLGRVGTL